MNYLVDTHILLWSLFSPRRVSRKVKGILSESETIKFVSVISIWEIAIKFSLGKLDLKGVLPDTLPAIVKSARFEILDLNVETAASFYRLPKIGNKDPFDRMLAWQAISYDYHLLTKDKDLSDYKDYGLEVIY